MNKRARENVTRLLLAVVLIITHSLLDPWPKIQLAFYITVTAYYTIDIIKSLIQIHRQKQELKKLQYKQEVLDDICKRLDQVTDNNRGNPEIINKKTK